jgi:hypothetical protein
MKTWRHGDTYVIKVRSKILLDASLRYRMGLEPLMEEDPLLTQVKRIAVMTTQEGKAGSHAHSDNDTGGNSGYHRPRAGPCQ